MIVHPQAQSEACRSGEGAATRGTIAAQPKSHSFSPPGLSVKSVANTAVTWLVATGFLAIGCVRLGAGSIAWGTALLLFGVIVGTAAVRSPNRPVARSSLGSALVIVFAGWVGLGLVTYSFASSTVMYMHGGPHHSVLKGLVGVVGVALTSAGFGVTSIGLRRGLGKWLS